VYTLHVLLTVSLARVIIIQTTVVFHQIVDKVGSSNILLNFNCNTVLTVYYI